MPAIESRTYRTFAAEEKNNVLRRSESKTGRDGVWIGCRIWLQSLAVAKDLGPSAQSACCRPFRRPRTAANWRDLARAHLVDGHQENVDGATRRRGDSGRARR